MIIHSSFKNYRLEICQTEEFANELIHDMNTFFLLDQKVFGLYGGTIFKDINTEKLIQIEAIEENKTIETVLNICEAMTKLPQKRNIHLVSVGGGIIQDITGLVANILYRGIPWTFIPTTLLAACDSCIGGKTSLNYKNYKNLLGTFYPPDEILIYPAFFKTLTERDFCSGLGEVVKFNVLRGEENIEKLYSDIDSLLKRDEETLQRYISSSLAFKQTYIEEDEFDRGVRVYLNYAHTFGHAIESVTKYEIPHGTAVAMGMVVANHISMRRGMLEETVVTKIEELVSKIIHMKYDFNSIVFNEIINAIHNDKKQVDNHICAILIDEGMNLKKITDINEKEIRAGFKHLTDFLEEISNE